jgi:hypothetical protein
MSPEFIAILQKLAAEQGRETLFNTARCKSFLADYTCNEFKKESRLLLLALDAGVQRAIDTTDNITICKKQQIRVLREDHFMAEELAVDVVDALALVLKGDTSRTEIQNEIREEKPQTASVQPQQPAPKINAGPKIGDIIPFGNYKWRVLDVQGNEALIITEDVIEKRGYSTHPIGKAKWETSGLRKYLNGKFLQEFTKEQQERIIEKSIPYSVVNGSLSGISKNSDTQDKIFLLSQEEASKYFSNDNDRMAYLLTRQYNALHKIWYGPQQGINEKCTWWLRSFHLIPFNSFIVYDGCAMYVENNGQIVNCNNISVNDAELGVRPALWLKV